MENQYIELAKKLKKLAETGVGGERYNAQKQLDRVMEKHGITKEQLEDDVKVDVVFKIRRHQKRLFGQVLASVIGMNAPAFSYRKAPCTIFVSMTKVQEAEVRAKFGFYWRAWQDQQELFMRAFIMKNNLYPADGQVRSSDQLTAKEMAETLEAFRIASGLPVAEYFKPIK